MCHVGVFGNGAVDRAAKAALDSGSEVEILYTVGEIGETMHHVKMANSI